MKTLTREEAIDKLRAKLLDYVDDDHSICDVAARLHIFCGGFAQWTFTELKKRHPMIVKSRPYVTPAELKDLANRWQLARQFATGNDFACDVQLAEGEMRVCQGWNEFTDADLAGFVSEICGETVHIGSPAA
jgi:hypothetical protein